MSRLYFKKFIAVFLSMVFVIMTISACSSTDAESTVAGSEESTESEEIDITSEEYAGLLDGYDPDVDDPDAERVNSEEDESLEATAAAKRGNSKLVEYIKISPNKSTPRNHKIDTITIHCMANQLPVETCGNVFANSKAQASANYGVGQDGRIALYVEEKDRSWASSNSQNDNRAVTITVASNSTSPYAVSDKAYDATIKLVADICQRNGITKLVWSEDKVTRINHKDGANMTVHRDFANKACPGDYLYNRMGDIADKVNKILESK